MIDRTHEARLTGLFGPLIAGVDEAGRGPIAGPVVAAAVILPDGWDFSALNDSKKLGKLVREQQAALLLSGAGVGVGLASVDEIDQINILQATMLAMRRAVANLPQKPSALLIDGNRLPDPLPCPAEALVKGDAREACIAAASIIAKTHRDKIMCDLAVAYPVYGFDRHVGYPTKAHLQALDDHGATSVHRQTFRPVREILTRTKASKPMTP